MFRKFLMIGALVTAVLVPVGVAAASSTDGRAVVQESLQTQSTIQTQNPDCDGTCVGGGPGAGPRDGVGRPHEGPQNGTGNRFGADDTRGRRVGVDGERGGYGAGPADGSAPLQVRPGDGTGNRFGVASGAVNPDDGIVCDGTRRHAPNPASSAD